MSFGFSVGDILLASKLAYKLYSTITDGRRSAAKDLKELGDVLFGLRCALDHLGKAAEDIRATASNPQDANAVEIRQKLDSMIASCGATLQELDSVTKRYREAVKPADNEVVNDDDTELVTTVGTSTPPNKQRSMARFKENVQVNWLKIRWSMERNSLGEYRTKLQSHVDAINMVLNTFLWSATHRVEVDGRVNAEKMQELQNQALQSNTSLLQLAQEIRTLLLPVKDAPSQPPPRAADPSQRHPQLLQNNQINLAMAGDGGPAQGPMQSINHRYKPPALTAMTQPPDPTDNMFTPPAPLPIREKPSSNVQVAAAYLAPKSRSKRELPASIVQLNLRRQSSGQKAFQEYQKKYFEPNKSPQKSPPPNPFLLSLLGTPTVAQLRDGLSYVFRSFPGTTARQATLNRDERKREVIRWTQGLEHLLYSWTRESTIFPSDTQGVKQAKQNELVDLFVSLNSWIENSNDDMKRLFYQATAQAGIDRVLEKLQTVSQSVRAMKEIEEFEDARDEWKDSQNGG